MRMHQWFKDQVQDLVDERMARDYNYEQRMEEKIAGIKRDYDERMEQNIAKIRREHEEHIAGIKRDYHNASVRIAELERQLPMTNSRSTESVLMGPSDSSSFYVKFTIGQLERSQSVCDLPLDTSLKSHTHREVGICNAVLMTHL